MRRNGISSLYKGESGPPPSSPGMAMALHSVTVTDAKEESERGGAHPVRPTGDGEEGDSKGRVTGLLSPVVRHPPPCLRFAPPCQITSIGTRHGSTTQAGRQIYRHAQRTALEPCGGSGTRSGTGGRDGRVSHAIGKGNERALHVQLLHTALRLRDGRGGAEGALHLSNSAG